MEITSVTNSVGIDRALAANMESTNAAVKTTVDTKTASKAPSQKAAGTRPASGGGAKPAAKASSAAATTSSSVKTYDKRDLNQDGTVTPQEAAKYALLHPTITPDTQPSASTNPVIQGLKAYQEAQVNNELTSALDTSA